MAKQLFISDNVSESGQFVNDEDRRESKLALSSERVGIGVADPFSDLHRALLFLQEPGSGPSNLLTLRRQSETASQLVRFNLDPDGRVFHIDVMGSRNSRARIHFGDQAGAHNPLTTLGDVGIGRTDPQVRLDVRGDAKIEKSGSPKLSIRSRGSGTQHYSCRATNNQDPAGGRKFIIRNEDQGRDDLSIDAGGNIDVAGDIRLLGADCAEAFSIVDAQTVEPGNVMVVTEDGHLRRSSEAYDRKVAGVVSGAGDYWPGLILGRQDGSPANHLPIALIGKVCCTVDADYEPIEVGDLLTTSPTPGHAMKAADPERAFGAVLGKALRPLDSGRSLIPVLVALQ